ncbi:hypothetical protein ACSBR1_012515 [Camellia fascicularis]
MVFWNESTDCCSWGGVTYDWLNGHVIGLDLSCILVFVNCMVNSQKTFSTFQTYGSSLYNIMETSRILEETKYDAFPYWLETLPELQVLVLKFKTKSKLHFPKLRIINISYNEFTSLLPTNYISRFEAMMNVDEHELKLKYIGDMYYKDYVVVIVKGHEIEYSRILTVISIIDLSSNKFIGEILKSIGRLNSLRDLNLSHNNLKGQIPTSLGNLSNLESLDLSSDQLVRIPQQLTSLMFLAVLNLSYNQLVGQIP